MAKEITLSATLRIFKGSLNYQSNPTFFQADMNGAAGPSPGSLPIPAAGLDVTFPNLTRPAMCIIQNLSANITLDIGVRDANTNEFYVLDEIQPGEFYPRRLSRHLGEHYIGTGTGASSPASYLHIKPQGNVAGAVAVVNAFEA